MSVSEYVKTLAKENTKQVYGIYLLRDFNQLFMSKKMKKFIFTPAIQKKNHDLLKERIHKSSMSDIINQAKSETLDELRTLIPVISKNKICFSGKLSYIDGVQKLCNYLFKSIATYEKSLEKMNTTDLPKKMLIDLGIWNRDLQITLFEKKNSYFKSISKKEPSTEYEYPESIQKPLFYLYKSLSIIERILNYNLFFGVEGQLHPLYHEIQKFQKEIYSVYQPLFEKNLTTAQYKQVSNYSEKVINSNLFDEDNFAFGYYIIAELMKLKNALTSLLFESRDSLNELDFYYYIPLNEYQALSLSHSYFIFCKKIEYKLESFQQVHWGIPNDR